MLKTFIIVYYNDDIDQCSNNLIAMHHFSLSLQLSLPQTDLDMSSLRVDQ